jgi:hypothetical protein
LPSRALSLDSPNDFGAKPLEGRIGGQHRHAKTLGLGHQKPVEGIAVQEWEFPAR